MVKASVKLYFREGTSDKVYEASVSSQGPGYVVNFAFGRRGANPQVGTKTPAPVPLEEAMGIYEKLVASKKAKGYAEEA